MAKNWLITGASRGFGRVWTEAALARGDRVAATARNVADVADLQARFGDAVLPLALDVTDDERAQEVVRHAWQHFGTLDVVLNNAGYTLVGTAEEAAEPDVRALFDTNYFGMLHVIKAALPLLRQQRSGHIIGVSSTVGIVSMPLIGFYCATKWAVEALHESLAAEVRAFGIKVSLIEPGAYATEFAGPSSLKQAEPLEAYDAVRQQVMAHFGSQQFGDPTATSDAVLKLVDSEDPPLRLILGTQNLPLARATYAERLATWTAWEEISNSAQGASIPVKLGE